MNDSKPTDATTAPRTADGGAIAPDVDALLQPLARALASCRLYGLRHRLTIDAVEEAFESLVRLLRSVNELHLAAAEDALIVNGATLHGPGQHTTALAATLRQLGIAGLRFVPGIAPDEFVKIVTLLTATPRDLEGKPMAAHLAEAGLEHVGVRTGTYMQVCDDQVVVARREDEKEPASGAAVLDADGILQFLKGDTPAGEPMPFLSVEVACRESGALAGLVLRATQAGLAPETASGKFAPGNALPACLRRLYDGLALDPAVKTQKGRKKLSKALSLLEACLLDALKSGGIAPGDSTVAGVSALLNDLRDGLDADALITEYAKRRKALELSEKRLLRMMETLGADGVAEAGIQGKLALAGVPPEDWMALASKAPKQ